MNDLEFVALLLAVVGPLIVLVRLLRVPQSLALVGAGIGSTFVPGLPSTQVDPQILLTLFLPPIIYAAAVQVSVHLLRFTLLPGVLVGFALTAATIPAVAVAARWLLPDLGWTQALMLGGIVALFDTRLFDDVEGSPHVPRAITDALKARSIAARVAAFSIFTLLLDAVEGGAPAPLAAVASFAWSIGAGVAVGWALGWGVIRLRDQVEPTAAELAVSIALPYLASLAARWLDLSVLATVMAAALAVSTIRIDRRTGAPRTSTDTRIAAAAFWEGVSLLLSAVLFLLTGRALPGALSAVADQPVWPMAVAAAALILLIPAVRFAFSYASAAPREQEAGAGPSRLATAGIMAWASTPSVIALIVALSIPSTVEGHGLLLVTALFVVLGSIVLQGLTLRLAVRAGALGDEGEEQGEHALAERTAVEAARGEQDGHNAARRSLLKLREENRIGDEMLRKMLRETDLSARAAEGSAAALPSANPSNP